MSEPSISHLKQYKLCSNKQHNEKQFAQYICFNPECRTFSRLFCAQCIYLHVEHQNDVLYVDDIMQEVISAKKSELHKINTKQTLANHKQSIQLVEQFSNKLSLIMVELTKQRINMKNQLKQYQIDRNSQNNQKFQLFYKEFENLAPQITQIVNTNQLFNKDNQIRLSRTLSTFPKFTQQEEFNLQKFFKSQPIICTQEIQQIKLQIFTILNSAVDYQLGNSKFVLEKQDGVGQWDYMTFTQQFRPPSTFVLNIIEISEDSSVNYFQGCFGISFKKMEFTRNFGTWYSDPNVYSVSIKHGYKLYYSKQEDLLKLNGEPGRDYKKIYMKIDGNMNIYFKEPKQQPNWKLAFELDGQQKNFYIFVALIYLGKISVGLA